MFTIEQYRESADFIRSRVPELAPEVLIILGSGLGFLADQVEGAVQVSYADIPHFRPSTAPGHKGQFVIGRLGGRTVMVMQGRMHFYEGYSAQEAAYPVRVAKLLGAHSMIATNACGAINLDYRVGDLVLISDHIKLFEPTPLRGENLPAFGPRFCDMTWTYDPEYRALAKRQADERGMTLHEGVYFYFPGPQFETPAEIRAARVLGGDVCGMSTVYEAIAANHCGLRTMGLSLVTNMAAGVSGEKLDGVDVLQAAELAREGLNGLIAGILPEIRGEAHV